MTDTLVPARRRDPRAAPGEVETSPVVRCAVYTRKSTEEGLEQEFNSLDAQREAAEAFIQSQKHQGWVYLPDRYDDGGYSGGNAERPALQRLLADVEGGRIDCIVVYKVDRLTRSLLDFARIVEVLERHRVTFVAVTQQLNTTTSMGRLTLNVLLSFAQFERELISERTSDKMSAARRKGKWVGGTPMLGYDVDPAGGRLRVNALEAEQVRRIFACYLQHESLVATAADLTSQGITTKRWRTQAGRVRGGRPFDRASLYILLANPIYTGRVNHKGTLYPGEHEAILDEATWQSVQQVLLRNRRTGGAEVRNRYGALLRGVIRCGSCGCAMSHGHTEKRGRRYRYYVCLQAQKQGWATCPTKSVSAGEIEALVVDRIRLLGQDRELAEQVVARVEATQAERRDDLARQRRQVERERREVETGIREAAAQAGQGPAATARLADLHDRLRALDGRLAALQQAEGGVADEHVDDRDLRRALAAFDPVWSAMSTKEQARLVRLLVEEVAYDGPAGKATIRFRADGLRVLAEGAW
ncbi:MAG: recombinase family protein [Planctomycetes bacterium]|nr:recombinase family protein [Planctomycetota bacterium]